MFAVVRTGGKQYRVAAGDKIVVEKMAGSAGDTVSLGDVLFASDDGEVKSGLTVSAEIIAQAKADKIIVFKKKRRHNYRRKAGHRQQHTILKILSVGEAAKKAAPKKEAAPVEAAPAAEALASKPAKAPAAAKAETPAAEKKPAAKKAAPKAAKSAE
jgi:large subunit ribosomal protein L21